MNANQTPHEKIVSLLESKGYAVQPKPLMFGFFRSLVERNEITWIRNQDGSIDCLKVSKIGSDCGDYAKSIKQALKWCGVL